MPRSKTVYTVSEGYSTGDLLHYAWDHITTAQHLLSTGDSRYFDSAGYVAHIGFELLFKACHLHQFGKFEKTHQLEMLYRELIGQGKIDPLCDSELQTLRLLDSFAELRYPNPANPVEVGDDDRPRISKLAKAIWKRIPNSLHENFHERRWSAKGGRVLMERPIG